MWCPFAGIVDGFETKWGYPQYVGAIDGSHIPIVSPTEYPADYHNRKGWHSIIVLQAVVDHECCIWNINIGWPCRVHSARVLTNSDLLRSAKASTLLPNQPCITNGVSVPLVILGDPAYPPIASMHGCKGRWRCLLKRNDITTDDISTQIADCCALHNICEVHKEDFDEALLTVEEDIVNL